MQIARKNIIKIFISIQTNYFKISFGKPTGKNRLRSTYDGFLKFIAHGLLFQVYINIIFNILSFILLSFFSLNKSSNSLWHDRYNT